MPLLLSSHLSGYISWTNQVHGLEPARVIPRMNTEQTADFSDARHAADARLLGLVAAGDSAALGELYDRFSRPLYATAVRILNDPGEAQDIVHDAFVSVWEKAASFETTRGTAFSWVLTLTRNRAIDRLRSRRRRHELLESSALSDLGLDENSSGPAADRAASTSDQATTLRAAVAALPADQQRALKLAFFSGLTQEEIAARLETPLGTIKARIRRGLLKLRDQLANRL
ncbi:MAG: sigma-70 family RNA polymerase sigma factor [Opitutaceae bacterium]|jgi:RNA polymerase sigma-70 factor (ECF subfamily)|nr:sigma-70 family RNA polymerase sigma factor [Opitutaceae bacterium]